MEAILLGIYAFFVWLIFFKFKLLPWNTISMVIVITIPVVALTMLVLLLNIFAPSTADVRVFKYVVNIVPQVRGRVIEVPIEPNKLIKRGDVLFKIDPTPYQLQVKALEAQLANAEGGTRKMREELTAATSKSGAVRAQLELARRRVEQNRQLVATGAGDRFALEQAQANVAELQAQLAASIAGEAQVRATLSATVDDDQAEIAQIKAQLENSRWELLQTTIIAPSDGYAINLQLRVGSMTAAFPVTPVMTFVENEYQVIALYQQNELHQVAPGDEAEFTLKTRPGTIFKAKVESIIWAQGQGQLANATQLPTTGMAPIPPGRFGVRLDVDSRHQDEFFAAGAVGEGAIYTQHLALIHIIRKIILRVGSKLDVLILKLH
ncbi:HlyD family secretion protein [Variovorax sp. J22P240]|uniref:HlyD family secretion protein n=1 Tax=Variovorax sp. J22P240 TaxID=3053514 RepID=UPI0025765490|nr:HlyD family secretion protein [Variovorax sp. J22P240]MDL9997474.1 HlyD family secretion protein [Variovorax sp. J22P240]